MLSVLFVCLGNICRSPCAEGVLMDLVKNASLEQDVHVESCGLGDWHEGQLPDERMRHVCKKRGLVLQSRAQAFKPEFFDTFDYILAADHQIEYQLHRWAKHPNHKVKIHLFTKFSSINANQEIPDPYYEEMEQFDRVLDMIKDSCQGVLEELRGRLLQ
ncbi:MAG: low molecular weight protein-tyrosine-phosphatase [Waddliaceae bacterium]